MPFAITWDAAFKAKPVTTDRVGDMYIEIQNTRAGIEERIVLEHSMDAAANESQGLHKEGSARAYVAATADTPVPPTGFEEGRLWYDSTTGAMKVHNGTSFTEVPYVHTTGNETVAGIKTFSSLPKTATTAWGTAVDADIVSKKAIEDYVNSIAFKRIVAATAIPAGFTYVQYPGTDEPNTIYADYGFTFTEITDTFAGAFFRAYKDGVSEDFTPMKVQAQQLLAHTHAIANNGSVLSPFTTAGEGADYTSGFKHYPLAAAPIITSSAGGGADLYPANYAIKIWKRNA
jgi:hypothetical protein